MKIVFPSELTINELNALTQGNMGEMLGIEFVEIGPDFLRATMPVRASSKQPFGLLHGGASVALAETVASVAAQYALDPKENKYAVGLEINANHVKGVRSGSVVATCKPLQLGGRISVWEVKITNEEGELVCISRMTAAHLEKRPVRSPD